MYFRFLLSSILIILISHFGIAQSWNEVVKVVASDRANDDNYGYSVSISGDYAVVGAWVEDEDELGANTITDAGSAYILENIAGNWVQIQKIVASDRGIVDRFGRSVAMSGNYAVIGAYFQDLDSSGSNFVSNAGAAYIFENIGGTWTEVQKIVASDRSNDDQFGFSVAISGNYIIVGAWAEDDDVSGMNSQNGAGSAYIFENSGGVWTEVQKIVASDRAADDQFGFSVGISGNNIIVSAPAEDEDELGANTLIDAGSAYIFENTAGTWNEVQKIVSSDRFVFDIFGWAVAISGDVAVITAPFEDEDALGGNSLLNAGSAYIFQKNAGTWNEVQKIVGSGRTDFDGFGESVSISGDYVIVGDPGEDLDDTGNNFLGSAGAAYIYNNTGGTWIELQKLVASDRSTSDQYGWAVAITDNHAIVGANWDADDTLGGINRPFAGSAYILEFDSCVVTSGTDIQIACDSFTWIDGNTYTTNNNTATFTLTNSLGCDSIVTLDLTILNSNTGSETITACDNYNWNGQNITVSGTYLDTLINNLGCDSIVTLNLTINSSSTGSEIITACDSYTWPTNGQTYTSSGTQTATLTNAAGCDSVVTLTLTINNSTSTTLNESICSGDTFVLGSQTLNSSGTYTEVLPGSNGCDSTITLNLTVNSVDTSVTVNNNVLTANASGATYQWIDCDNANALIPGETNQSFTASQNGNYAVIITENNCTDTSLCFSVVGINIYHIITSEISVYPNPAQDRLTLEIPDNFNLDRLSIVSVTGKLIQEIDVVRFSNSIMISDLENGIYNLILEGNGLKHELRFLKE